MIDLDAVSSAQQSFSNETPLASAQQSFKNDCVKVFVPELLKQIAPEFSISGTAARGVHLLLQRILDQLLSAVVVDFEAPVDVTDVAYVRHRQAP